MSEVNTRVLVSAAVIAGGTALAVASGGIPAAAALALAAVFGNIYAADLADVWRKRKDDPRYKHPNDDLTRLVGEAIARVLYDCAQDNRLPDPGSKEWCRTLAQNASVLWTNLSAESNVTAINEVSLPQIFAASAQNHDLPLLDTHSWEFVLDDLQTAAGLDSNPVARHFAAQRLHQNLFHEIQERIKIDFSSGGRAYAALNIDMSPRILAGVQEILDKKVLAVGQRSSEMNQLQKIQLTLDKFVTTQHAALKPNQVKSMQPVLDDIKRIQQHLENIRIDQASHEYRERNRHQFTWWLTGVIGLLTIIGIGIVYSVVHIQRGETKSAESSTARRLDRIERQLSGTLANKPAGQEATVEISPELRLAAAELLERGNKKQRRPRP